MANFPNKFNGRDPRSNLLREIDKFQVGDGLGAPGAIQPGKPYNPFTVAETMLPQSSSMRGLDGMSRTSAPPGPNAYDQGGSSKPSVNTQPYNNQRLAEQNMMVRQADALPQAQAEGVQAFRKQQQI